MTNTTSVHIKFSNNIIYIMNIKSILLTIVIIILLYVVIRYVSSDVSTLTATQSATIMQTIPASNLSQGSTGANTSNFTFSIWFYINDWNYRYGESKIIFGRMNTPSTYSGTPTATDGISGADPSPIVTLGAMENSLAISLACFPGSSASDSNNSLATNSVLHTCNVSNVPIQKWVNLLVSTYGRSMDIYLDGKLVNTCVLPGIAKINQNANVYVTPAGGFSGWTAKFQYFPNPTNPQTAWDIYQQGYGSGFLSNLLGKYKIQMNFINDTATTTI